MRTTCLADHLQTFAQDEVSAANLAVCRADGRLIVVRMAFFAQASSMAGHDRRSRRGVRTSAGSSFVCFAWPSGCHRQHHHRHHQRCPECAKLFGYTHPAPHVHNDYFAPAYQLAASAGRSHCHFRGICHDAPRAMRPRNATSHAAS